MKHLRLLARPVLAAMLLSAVFVVASCSDDDDDGGTNPTPTTGDYFPYGYQYRWTYTSNILAEKGTPVIEFDMKIDSLTTNKGLFDFIMIRSSAWNDIWYTVFGVEDDGNTIYALGDHPPEVRHPIFKHTYEVGELVPETITVQGETLDALRMDIQGEHDVTISLWFAPNIGLVKEYSEQGGSIFTDDQWGDDVIMNTELVSFGIP